MFFWRRVAPQVPEEGLKPTATPSYTRNFRDLNQKVSQGKSFSGYERNALLINREGKGFAEVGGLFGVDFEDDARAVAVVDWDRDGDLDLWVTNRTAPQVRLLKNNQPATNSSIAIRLLGNGRTTNRDAIGARLTLSNPSAPSTKQIRTVHAGDGFLAQSSSWTHFGIGTTAGDFDLTIDWPGGETETLSGLKANSRYTITQGEGRANNSPLVSNDLSKLVATHQVADKAASHGFWVANPLPFPALTFTDANGATHSTTEFIGKPVLINFWATWCAPCVEELATLAKHADALNTHGVDILALNVDGLALDGSAASGETAASLLARVGFELPHGTASQDNLAKIEILIEYLSSRRTPLSIPASFLVDEKGNIAAVYLKAVTWKQLDSDLALLNASPDAKLTRATPRPGRWLADPRQGIDRRGYLGDFATLFATNGFPGESQRLYQMTTGQSNANAQEYYNQAKSAAQQGATKKAEELYRTAIRIDPNYGPALTGLGAVLLKAKRIDEAKTLFEKALAIDPNHATALMNLAMIDQSKGDNQKALERLRTVIARNPGYPQAHLNIGSLLASMKQHDEAIRHLSKAIELEPTMIPAHVNLAVAYTKAQQWKKAEEQYRKLQQVSPRMAAFSHFGIGNIQARGQRHKEAIASYQKAIALGGKTPQTFTQLGRSFVALGNNQAGIDAFNSALRLDSGYEPAKHALKELTD